jgi:acyl-lipid omega-6 desaturase (Delta-12 desaturase)
MTSASIAAALPSRPALDFKTIARDVAAFRGANTGRGVTELILSAVPLALLWVLMWLSLDLSYLVTLVLAVPAAGFLLRLFLIQHDCGHGSYFRGRRANDWTGRMIGVLTLTPYHYWRRTHAMHHAGTGNLDKRGVGDVATLTVREYSALGTCGKLGYRLYRNPIVLFGLGPAYVFLLQHRLPVGLMRAGWQPWLSTMGTNLAAAILWIALAWAVGIGPFLMIQLPITLIAASTGVWLFYIQHQFEDAYWQAGPGWNFHEAALMGSSHYVLPPVLRWITANIGVHHIHHLCSAVPFYRLQSVLERFPHLAEVNRMTIGESIRTIPHVLWDEEAGRLVRFRDVKRAA